jgi:hypothetical protein
VNQVRSREVDFFGYRVTGSIANAGLIALFLVVGLVVATPFIVMACYLNF